jgi:hypothetical protein
MDRSGQLRLSRPAMSRRAFGSYAAKIRRFGSVAIDLARVVAAIALLLTGTGIVVATFALPFAGIAGLVALCWRALG